ncbi:MAG TPA: hypothetical protein VGB81_06050 [Devosia sp.]|jgi:hypothetical protein
MTRYAIECSTEEQRDALAAVLAERRHQDRSWGPGQGAIQVGSYINTIRKLLNDAERAYGENRTDAPALGKLIEVVAAGLACLEQHGVPQRAKHE